MTEKFPEDFLPLKNLVGDYTDKKFQKQLDQYYKKILKEGITERFIADASILANDYPLLALHKFVDNLFKDIENKFPDVKLYLPRMIIFILMSSKIDSIREKKGIHDNQKKLLRNISFIQNCADDISKSFIKHKLENSNTYKNLVRFHIKMKEYGIDNSILNHCFL